MTELSRKQLMTKEGLQSLNHELPSERYEDYMLAIIHHVQDESISAIKKTVRVQKIMRLMHDEHYRENEILKAAVRVLVDANEFYASNDSWGNICVRADGEDDGVSVIISEKLGGDIARQAKNSEEVKKAMECLK